MIFDIFFSICQTEVDGFIPSESEMLRNFFEQVILADQLGYDTAWVAETHLSCQVQKENPGAVIPDFKGEIGLNTDILQLAHKIFSLTKKINVGSAIRNILCNGGPIAHAEAIRTFLLLHTLNPQEKRLLNLGFASGRFEFSNRPYGIVPRSDFEKAGWPVVKGKIFKQALEIFLRLLRGEKISSADISPSFISRSDFRSDADWQKVLEAYGENVERIFLPGYWQFEKIGIIPQEVNLDNLRLTIGSHDSESQLFANQFLPCGVFNLSITPTKQIEETHQRMLTNYHSDGGDWKRTYMPRTVLIFLNDDPSLTAEEQNELAQKKAKSALANYWKAIQGTLDNSLVENAVNNALVGNPREIIKQLQERFHPEDRLMLWFDFNNHNNSEIKQSMTTFTEKVIPFLA